MNYACLMLGAMFIFALMYYLVYGRRFYKGPSGIRACGGGSTSDSEV